ncbi:ubiquitin-conjugating enzyme/RWD-like protein [Lineolata rhizophorae]|uniref:Ubiquitin-conjugating enzyme E2 2 n=1 Tax=Lineolata rhizophorae TaxID=578093 RepID=A0A6A6NQ01_9PEZI|nr:ubiquitin-conjugating enzyme/RWD-like protein [Lineolata rhizophorae]
MDSSAMAPSGSAEGAKSASMSRSANNNANVTKRLQTELMSLMMSTTPGISAFPNDGNLLEWTGTIVGPEGTPYAGLSLKLSFDFPANYPYEPPTVLFKTPVYHPNIDFAGRICLDILKDKWSAIYNVQSVLLSLQSLLGEPNNASPLNGQAAELWDKDPAEFKRLVLARHRDDDE